MMKLRYLVILVSLIFAVAGFWGIKYLWFGTAKFWPRAEVAAYGFTLRYPRGDIFAQTEQVAWATGNQFELRHFNQHGSYLTLQILNQGANIDEVARDEKVYYNATITKTTVNKIEMTRLTGTLDGRVINVTFFATASAVVRVESRIEQSQYDTILGTIELSQSS